MDAKFAASFASHSLLSIAVFIYLVGVLVVVVVATATVVIGGGQHFHYYQLKRLDKADSSLAAPACHQPVDCKRLLD